MNDFHGIIFAYSAASELGELVGHRTAASLPFCGRYRLIDFSLSSFRNAGILDVGVIMQRDYQSLLDHLGGGKDWDMNRRTGGLKMLPPFGLPEYHKGNYSGTMEALIAVSTYISDIPQKHIVLIPGNVLANIDMNAACKAHLDSGADITAICCGSLPNSRQYRYVAGSDGFVRDILFDRSDDDEGVPGLEAYIVKKDALLSLIDRCRAQQLYRFHRDAISLFLKEGGKMNIYMHDGYARNITNVSYYYGASMDMLSVANRRSLFPAGRPVLTKMREGVSTYYGENAVSRNSLVGDDCIIEGTVENSIIFSGARIGKGAVIRDSILMPDCTVGPYTELKCVIADKNVSFSGGLTLTGNEKLPVVAPKNSSI